MTPRARMPALLFAATLTAGACGEDGSAAGSTTITVSAAASLADALTDIADDFAGAEGDVEVTLNVDSSASLASQIAAGAPADVFASADEETMAVLVDDGLVAGTPSVIAHNELVIVTEPGNPADITSLGDLADVGVVSLCAEQAPCGRYAATAFDEAGVSVPADDVTRGQNARATLTAVSRGDAAAGVVYRTDALAAGDVVDVVPIEASGVAPTAVIGVVQGAGERSAADAFVAHVLSDRGQTVLEEHGFLPAG